MTTDGPRFDALLEYLRHHRGFDFSSYKRTTLMRRIQRRMQAVGVEDYGRYRDYLEVTPDEFVQLFNTILINVTAFFRDPDAWQSLERDVLPDLLRDKPSGGPVRVWSVGCSSGQEAYTLAILLCEALRPEAFLDRVKIYATDLDEEALASGRQAVYLDRDVKDIPDGLVDRYFERAGPQQYLFRKDLRRAVIFGRHDLLQDAPISRVDLLVCRNTLMYFNADAQARILAKFHFALNDHGVLFLGKAETLLTNAAAFAPLDLKRRIFAKVAKPDLRERMQLIARISPGEDGAEQAAVHAQVRELSFDTHPIAQMTVDAQGAVLLANQRARSLFGLSMGSLGQRLYDLEVGYRPVELRPHIERAAAERRTVVVRDVKWTTLSGDLRWWEVHIVPLQNDGAVVGANILFQDVTDPKQIEEQYYHSKQELETTAGELQSTNEELEAINEELQSTNEELEALNEELNQRTLEVDRANAFLESILGSLESGVAVLDADLRVMAWNRKMEDLWGLRTDEVRDRHFLNLDIGLPVEQLRTSVRTCLAERAAVSPIALEARDRRGKGFRCKVTCAPMLGDPEMGSGVIMLMEPV